MIRPEKIFHDIIMFLYTLQYDFEKEKLDKLEKLFEEFERSLEKVDIVYIDEFVYYNYTLLQDLKLSLTPHKQFSSMIDKIYINILNFKSQKGMNITRLFLNFVKGITYFLSEEETDVYSVYHRISSCGPRNALLTCKTLKNKNKQIGKKRIKKCLIERLIYDNLYRHETLFFPSLGTEEHTQDDRHIEALNRIRKEYQICFPNSDIEIEMLYELNKPISLFIKYIANNKIVMTDYYERRITPNGEYNPFILTIKKTSNGTYKRIQNYERKKRWSKSI